MSGRGLVGMGAGAQMQSLAWEVHGKRAFGQLLQAGHLAQQDAGDEDLLGAARIVVVALEQPMRPRAGKGVGRYCPRPHPEPCPV